METVTIRLADGILKVADIPVDTRVVLEYMDTGAKTTYKRDENGCMWKKHSRIEEVKRGGLRRIGING